MLDEVAEIEGVTPAMLAALGENGVMSVEDLAGCASDDLIGYDEVKDGQKTRVPGYFEGISVSRAEAEAIIMAARVAAGWIEAPAEEPPAEGDGEGDDA